MRATDILVAQDSCCAIEDRRKVIPMAGVFSYETRPKRHFDGISDVFLLETRPNRCDECV